MLTRTRIILALLIAATLLGGYAIAAREAATRDATGEAPAGFAH